MKHFKPNTICNPSRWFYVAGLLALLLIFACGSNGRSDLDRSSPPQDAPNEINKVETQVRLEDQKSPALRFAETITLDELKGHIDYLASDELEGRFSGTSGAHSAAEYIARHFRELELQGLLGQDQAYFQSFRMQKKQMKENYLESEHAKVENWIHFGERFSHFSGEKEAELIFAGYGRESDLAGIDITGKLVAFFPGDPDSSEMDMDREKVKMDHILEREAAGFLLIFEDESSRPAYSRFRNAYFGDVRYYLDKSAEEALEADRSIVIFASDLAALFGVDSDRFLAVQEEMKVGKNVTGMYQTSVRMKTVYDRSGSLNAKNVLAFIEGTDKKNEWIILTAHYDHLGTYRGDIYNGADDNASGVAALIEIAEAFALAAENDQRPRRTILFLAPDAEEIGANGSLFYVENPMVPLDETVVDINIDSIGREDAQQPKLTDFVYVYRSQNGRSDLDWARKSAEDLLPLKPQIEIKTTAPGSDNYMFERAGIPVLAYTTGRNRDYHKPSDTKNKLNYANLHSIARLIFVTTWEIANR
jgi:hypothetical protein